MDVGRGRTDPHQRQTIENDIDDDDERKAAGEEHDDPERDREGGGVGGEGHPSAGEPAAESVGVVTAEDHRGDSDGNRKDAGGNADSEKADMVHAHEEGRTPDAEVVRGEREERVTGVEIEQRFGAEEKRGVAAIRESSRRFGPPARLLAQEEDERGKDQPGKSEKVKRPSPAVRLSDPSTEKERQTATDGDAGGVDRLHRGAHPRREVIAE